MSKRALLVDDSDFVLAKLRSVVEADGELEVVATAGHGLAALEMAQALRPDLVTLDVRMPVMDGITCLKHLMVRRPVPVVMISAFTTADSHMAFDCLRFGAVDFVTKPRAGQGGDPASAPPGAMLEQGQDEIRLRLQRAANIDRTHIRFRRLAFNDGSAASHRSNSKATSDCLPAGLLVLSGGRSGLAEILSLVNVVPLELGLCVVIGLEQPVPVVESFAAYLSRFSACRVCQYEETLTGAPTGEISTCALRAGEIRLFSTEDPHLLVDDGTGAALHRVPAQAGRSAASGRRAGRLVEALFESVAEVYGSRSFGVLVSGAKQGAVRGLGHLVRAGGLAFVQDPGSAPAHSALGSALSQPQVSEVGNAHGWVAIMAGRLRGAGR